MRAVQILLKTMKTTIVILLSALVLFGSLNPPLRAQQQAVTAMQEVAIRRNKILPVFPFIPPPIQTNTSFDIDYPAQRQFRQRTDSQTIVLSHDHCSPSWRDITISRGRKTARFWR